MANYLRQNTQQTLAEGLEEYANLYQDHLRMRDMSPAAAEFFRCHDVAHVVFGCDISLANELIIKISSLFGTSAGFSVLQGYALAESKDVYETLKLIEIIGTAAKALILVPRTLYRCSRMPARWPWDDHSQFINQPLANTREEFGIRVALTADQTLTKSG